MLASRSDLRSLPAAAAEPATARASVAAIPLTAAAGIAAIGWLYYGNPRLLGSWHGFLHSAIATRFSAASFPPENPFFAGEPLPYYYFYHFIGYWLSRAAHLDLLHTFHALSWICLVAFVVFAGRIGRVCFRSSVAGVAIAWLGLAGLNPLGPAIAVARNLAHATPLVQHWLGPVETVFVSGQMADDLMTQPLLPAMYLGGDWRHGQNLVWFFDIGSRAPALAGLMLLLYLLLKPPGGRRCYIAIVAVSALITAFNPLIGLAAAGTLAAAAIMARGPRNWIALTATCMAGAALALPTCYQIFFRAGGSGATIRQNLALPSAVILANFLVLLPLAALGVRKGGHQMATIGIAAAVLLLVVIVVHLPEGNEHNLSNAAQCLLAVPAATVVANKRILGALLLTFLPVTAGTLVSYAARPPMPISTAGPTLLRTQGENGLEQFYEWIRRDTSRQSIFLTDPESPVKMSGNVSELPAFTARTLFTDTPNYLTIPNKDAAFRAQLASQATAGEALSIDRQNYLLRFDRPVYVVTYHAGSPEFVERLSGLYGAPAFRQGIVAAFRFAGGRSGQ